MILVLFDIDGTLIHTPGAGVRGMTTAFRRLHGRDDVLAEVPIAGRTDRAILSDGFRQIGVEPTSARLAALRDVYLEELPLELTRPLGPDFCVLPGVLEVLAALEADRSFAVALLTGNFATGAEIKLQRFDLWRRFRFGAFGDEHLDRRDLVPVAVERAGEMGLPVSRVVVIGDTPLDVDCAHAHGAIAIAVATGMYSRASLEAAGADLTLGTFTELVPTTELVAGLCGRR